LPGADHSIEEHPLPSQSPPVTARIAAVVALVGLIAIIGLVVGYALLNPGKVLIAAICLFGGVLVAWAAATSHRWHTGLAVIAVALLAAAFVLVLVANRSLVEIVALVGLTVVTVAAGRFATRWEVLAAKHRRWQRVGPAARSVLLMNPKSGSGKVEQNDLENEARKRGIEPIVIGPDDDLLELARRAVEDGADTIGMAGGDGSQALVASVAAERGVAFVCIPAGTRNHLALDLGIDRNDVVGALGAFGEARESTIDLGAVNDRVFVNNVCLGVYAEIVSSDAYRDAKVRTVTEMLPELMGRDAPPFDLQLDEPGGKTLEGPAMVLISNNPYRLGHLGGFGTRSRLDTGELGIAALCVEGSADVAMFVAAEVAGRIDSFPGWDHWSDTSVEVRSSSPIAAGIDGESCTLEPPLRFEIRPAALRVRIPRHAPGVSPAASRPGVGRSTIVGLGRIAMGRASGLIR
jgi:diacylglycerol kinase family enzyme